MDVQIGLGSEVTGNEVPENRSDQVRSDRGPNWMYRSVLWPEWPRIEVPEDHRSLLDNYAPLLTKTNKTSRTAPTPWITTEILNLKPALRRLELTYIVSHSITDFKLLRSATNHYHKLISAPRSHSTPRLSTPHPTLELFGKNLTQNCKSLPTHIISSGCPISATCHLLLW